MVRAGMKACIGGGADGAGGGGDGNRRLIPVRSTELRVAEA